MQSLSMKISLRKGFSFGLTSGIITTLGLIVGLQSSTNSQLAVIGGIVVIAIADAFSDSLGIHISEEAEERHTPREIWESTATTFLSKFAFAMSFIFPFLFLPLVPGIIVSVAWGLSLIVAFSYHLAKRQGISPYRTVGEHLLIAILVIIVTHQVGNWVSGFV
jgi:VIT1/CCC1 family predicted Fe2+/Mn2+ transporter